MHSVFADSERGRQLTATPMGGTVAGFLRVADRIQARNAGVRIVAFWPG